MEAEDAGASKADAPSATTDSDLGLHDGGPPPKWLVDEIESLRAAENGQSETAEQDAGPGPGPGN